MTRRVVVLGGGPNGLVAATRLAQAGRNVILVERRSRLGGLGSDGEIAPGFRSPGVLQDTCGFRPWVTSRLGLERHGLVRHPREVPVWIPTEASGFFLHRDPERLSSPLSRDDLDGYRRLRAFLGRVAPAIEAFLDHPPLDPTSSRPRDLWALGRLGLRLRLLGEQDLLELLRVAPASLEDVLSEHVAAPELQAALALPALFAGRHGPRAPLSTVRFLLQESVALPPFVGGGPALVKALVATASASGVELRLGSEVVGLSFDDDDHVAGVELASGETIESPAVLATCDPRRLFLELIEPHRLPFELEQEIVHYRAEGTLARLDLALDTSPRWRGVPDGEPVHRLRLAASLEELERGADAVKYRRPSDRPCLEVWVPSLDDPSLAPEGQHVIAVDAHWVPLEPNGGWTPESRAELERRIVARLDEVAPGLSSSVVASRLRTPADLERDFALSGGDPLHGEHAIDQLLVRPAPSCSRYASPLPGLWLGGSGSHPGGGLTGAPGFLAAETLLRGRPR